MAETAERWLEWAFQSNYATTGVAIGTDWTMGELYGLDWGEHFGRLESYRYPGQPWCCILPKRVDGGADVVISVLPAELEVLRGKEGLEKYLEK
ncbi:unnamed protein product [Sphagnum balticum]